MCIEGSVPSAFHFLSVCISVLWHHLQFLFLVFWLSGVPPNDRNFKSHLIYSYVSWRDFICVRLIRAMLSFAYFWHWSSFHILYYFAVSQFSIFCFHFFFLGKFSTASLSWSRMFCDHLRDYNPNQLRSHSWRWLFCSLQCPRQFFWELIPQQSKGISQPVSGV